MSCALFPADLNAQRLSRRFGAVNVVSREINLGEGDTAPGTVLFPDDRLRRVEIAWEDQRGQRQPQVIRVSGDETLWRTPQGITLRTTLEQVRHLNGKPVRILSFDRDDAGTVLSWGGGMLTPTDAGCEPFVAFKVTATSMSGRPRLPDAFSSDFDRLRSMRPEVYTFGIAYRR